MPAPLERRPPSRRPAAEASLPRILYVSPLPPPAGGIANWTRILTERGLPEGWSLDVVNTRNDDPVFGDWRTRLNLGQVRRWARILRGVRRVLREDRPDLVHVNLSRVGLGLYREVAVAALCRSHGVPYVFHYRGDFSPLGDLPRVHPHVRAWQHAARRAALNLALEGHTRALLQARVGGRSAVVQVPNYYDDREIPQADPPDWDGTARPRAIFVGGLTRGKGVDVLLEAARALPGVDWHLVGRPYDELADALAHAPENVVVHGEQPHDEVLAALARAHVFVFPSATEGFPNAVTEAMAVGLPAVVSDRGAMAEMIEDGPGGVVLPDRTVESVVAAVRAVLADPARRRAQGRHNQDRARRLYAYPRVVERLTRLYAHALSDASGPPPQEET